MGQLEAKEILSFAIERASALNDIWNLFIVVALGVLGLMASGKGFTTSPWIKVTLSLAFLAFAGANLDAMLRLGELRRVLLGMLPADLTNRPEVVAALSPATACQYVTFHAFLDAVVLAAIWFVPWPDR